ncbi:MAG: hypothetical protein AB1756_05085 [Acidobacteriota bacterium]
MNQFDEPSEFKELLRAGEKIKIEAKEGLSSPLFIRVGEKILGTFSFDPLMQRGEYRDAGGSVLIIRDAGRAKTVALKDEDELVGSYEKRGGNIYIFTRDSNILYLNKDGFWSRAVSLVEYETGCRFLRFTPGEESGILSIDLEVSPVFIDSEDLSGLLALVLFHLIADEIRARR